MTLWEAKHCPGTLPAPCVKCQIPQNPGHGRPAEERTTTDDSEAPVTTLALANGRKCYAHRTMPQVCNQDGAASLACHRVGQEGAVRHEVGDVRLEVAHVRLKTRHCSWGAPPENDAACAPERRTPSPDCGPLPR